MITSRTFRSMLVVLAFIGVASSTLGARADHCGSSARNAHDPFGSCEERSGRVHCGSTGAAAVDVPTLGRVIVGTQGVQFCADEETSDLPVLGRITIYNSEGHVGVAADGDDRNNAPVLGLSAGNRVDVDTVDGEACLSGWDNNTYWPEGGPNGGFVCAP